MMGPLYLVLLQFHFKSLLKALNTTVTFRFRLKLVLKLDKVSKTSGHRQHPLSSIGDVSMQIYLSL